ncbi:MAG TPA: 4Fe-4S binding protein [Anaerovoracaceae bacterium]|nr:4Fe-4S binding protein [Anaerovoracaceae bacterium]
MASAKKLRIEPAWCKGCGYCVEFCPKDVLELVNDRIHIKDESLCIKCGLCEMRCPDYAIYLEESEGE